MRNMKKRVVSISMLLLMLMAIVSGCGNQTPTDNINGVKDNYVNSVNMEYNPNGEYHIEIKLDSSCSDELTAIDAKDFTLKEIKAEQEDKNIEFTIDEATKDTISMSFKTSTEYDADVHYLFATDKAVTEGKCSLAAFIYIQTLTPEIDFEYSGAYYNSNGINGKLFLKDDLKFVENITNDMVRVVSEIDNSVELKRVSDKELDFDIVCNSTEYAGNSILVEFDKEVIDSKYVDDITLSLDYYHTFVEVDSANVTYDEATGKLTIGQIDAVTGVNFSEDAITVIEGDASIEQQVYDAENKRYKDIVVSIKNNEDPEKVKLGINLNTEHDSFVYEICPAAYLFSFTAEPNIENEIEKNKVDGTQVVTTLLQGLAQEMSSGGHITSAAIGIALPIAFDLLGVDTTDPNIKKIQDSLDGLSTELQDMRTLVKTTNSAVEEYANKALLDSFQQLGITLIVKSNSILSSEKVIKYVSDIQGNIDQSSGKVGDEKVIADQSFIDIVDKKGGTEYLSQVMNYGSKILSNSSGLSKGIVDIYASAIDAQFNFESQTAAAKEAFYNNVLTTYFLNAAIVIQYCDAIGDPNKVLMRTQLEEVCKELNKYTSIFENMKNRKLKGEDVLLPSGQTVKKEMVEVEVDKLIYNNEYVPTNWPKYTWEKIQLVTPETINTMALRAKTRKISLAQDLENAGFDYVSSNKASEYYYIVGDYSSKKLDITAGDVGQGVLSLFGGRLTTDLRDHKTDVVYQKGTEDSCTKKNFAFATDVVSRKNAYSKDKYYVNKHVETMIGFKKANE